jgi:hypothetical protein
METEPIVSLNESARAMGRKGGRSKSDAKLSACKENSRLSRGAVAQMAKRLHGRNLRADDKRILEIKRNLKIDLPENVHKKCKLEVEGMEA